MSSEDKLARIEIDTDTLLRLLKDQQLCAAELRCLDRGTKALLWRLCLNTCLKK